MYIPKDIRKIIMEYTKDIWKYRKTKLSKLDKKNNISVFKRRSKSCDCIIDTLQQIRTLEEGDLFLIKSDFYHDLILKHAFEINYLVNPNFLLFERTKIKYDGGITQESIQYNRKKKNLNNRHIKQKNKKIKKYKYLYK